MILTPDFQEKLKSKMHQWRGDWNKGAFELFGAKLDKEQAAILESAQINRMTSVASGTARGKDYVSAVAAMCFMYFTPRWKDGELVKNTKVAMTAPTDRQVKNIMIPEVSRLHHKMISNGYGWLAGRLTAYDIRTENEEWFLTGFKADEHNHEAWSGFHAVNTMFIVTEASGISESVFNAIEGNLQGNSRILIVFNPNIPTGYAAGSQKSKRWHHFRLDSLNAPNVTERKMIIPGQVDYEWVKDKVDTWCQVIPPSDFLETEGDFVWEGLHYRPNDLFRVKVRGMFPKVAEDILVPLHWIEAAQERWKAFEGEIDKPLRLGVDVAGMGRDSSAFCPRYGNYVKPFRMIQSGGVANHMEIVGIVKSEIESNTNIFQGYYPQAFLDTVGEGAGVYSRLQELNVPNVYSVKGGESAKRNDRPYKDVTGQYEFKNMRAYLYWAIRDWLNPANGSQAMLPPDDELAEELTETKWNMRSDGSIELESKDEIKKRLRRSPDKGDSLANTFYPVSDVDPRPKTATEETTTYFH